MSNVTSSYLKPPLELISSESARSVAPLLAAIVLLALLVSLVFGCAFSSALMPDDVELVVMGRVANERGFAAANRLQSEDVVRPLPVLIYAADYWLFGMNAAGYRLSMALIHLANALLVLALAWRFTRSRELSFLAAALFTTHFAHWENAVWIGTLDDFTLATGMLVALFAYERFRRIGGWKWYAVALVGTAAALLSKETAVAVAPMLFVTDLLIRPEPQPWRQRLLGAARRSAPFFLLCLLLLAAIVFSGILGRYSTDTASLSLFGRHIPRHAAGYLAWMLFPFQMAGSVPGVSEGGWLAQVFFAAFWVARVVGTLGVAWLLWRGTNQQRLLCLWLLIVILPYTFRTVMFPRYAYPTTAIFAVLAAHLACVYLRRRPERIWLVRAPVLAFIAASLLLLYVSPSVEAFRAYARAAHPIVEAVSQQRAEMSVARELWLVDPPPFSAPELRARARMWSQIASLVRDSPIPTRTMLWQEWQTAAAVGQVPPGTQAYRWHEGELHRLR